MKATTILRGLALVALLAPAFPAPASAQLGFIKKQLKQRIAQTVVDSAMSKVGGPSGDSSAAAPTPARAAPADSATSKHGIGGFLKKRLGQKVPVDAIPAGPARTDEGAAAQPGGRGDPRGGAPAAKPRATRDPASLTSRGAPRDGSLQDPGMAEFFVEITPRSLDRLEKYLIAQRKAASDDAHGSAKAPDLPDADRLTMVQYGFMTQRVVAFCAAAAPSGRGGATVAMLSAANGLNEAFTATEAAALRPRCSRFVSLLGEDY